MTTTERGHYDQSNTGYKLSGRDILACLEDLPTLHGSSPYNVAFREATHALTNEIVSRCRKGILTTECIYKNQLLKELKSRSLFWVSRLDCATAQPEIDLAYQERCLALSEFFATVYDLIHEEL